MPGRCDGGATGVAAGIGDVRLGLGRSFGLLAQPRLLGRRSCRFSCAKARAMRPAASAAPTFESASAARLIPPPEVAGCLLDRRRNRIRLSSVVVRPARMRLRVPARPVA
jgi:hypothetical protein